MIIGQHREESFTFLNIHQNARVNSYSSVKDKIVEGEKRPGAAKGQVVETHYDQKVCSL